MIESITIANVATYASTPEALNGLSYFNFLFGSNGTIFEKSGRSSHYKMMMGGGFVEIPVAIATTTTAPAPVIATP